MSAIEKIVAAGNALKNMAGNSRVDFSEVLKASNEWEESLRLLAEEQSHKPTAPASLYAEVAGLLKTTTELTEETTGETMPVIFPANVMLVLSRYTPQEEKPAVESKPTANADMVEELEDVIRAYTFRNNDDDFNSGCNRVCERISEIITKYRPVKANDDGGLVEELKKWLEVNLVYCGMDPVDESTRGFEWARHEVSEILARHKASDKGVK